MEKLRVLVVGYRKGLIASLRNKGVEFAVWHDSAIKVKGAVLVRATPFEQTPSRMRQAAEAWLEHGPFTHVIAGVERSVVTASYARQVLGARRSKHTTVKRCHDKLYMKETLLAHGVPMTPFRRAKHDEGGKGLVDELGAPLVVKDRRSSGGRGVEVLDSAAAADAVPKKMRIAERYVRAAEASVESFVHEGEICFVNYTEYLEKRHVNVVPARFDDTLVEQIYEVNRKVIEALNIRWGMTHLEVYRTDDGPLFGEVALRPPGGYIMELLELAYGTSAWDAFVDVELGLCPAMSTEPVAHAAAWIIHPGEGRVRSVEGLEAVRADPAVKEAKVSVKVDQHLALREGSGEEAGHVILSAPDRQSLLAALDRVQNALNIALE